MKRLILVRHGTYSHRSPMVVDLDCPLTRSGRREVSHAADRLLELQIQPDLMVNSPALRTVETAQIMSNKFGVSEENVRAVEEIYEAERAEILRIVHELDDSFETVMLVGHNPAATELLHLLVDTEIGTLPPASFVVFESTVDHWRQVSFQTTQLVHFSAPKVKGETYGWWWRFTFWRRQKVQKIELFIVFFVVLLFILGLIAVIVQFSTDPAGMPQQGSMGR